MFQLKNNVTSKQFKFYRTPASWVLTVSTSRMLSQKTDALCSSCYIYIDNWKPTFGKYIIISQ